MLSPLELEINKLRKEVMKLRKRNAELEDVVKTGKEKRGTVEDVGKVRVYELGKKLNHLAALPVVLDKRDGGQVYYLEVSLEQYNALVKDGEK